MAGVLQEAVFGLRELYGEFIMALPTWAGKFINLFLIVIVIVLYSIIIWKLYRFISKKDLFELNLRKYNRSEHPLFGKFVASIFYFVEYLLIVPFLVFVWFAFFTLFLMFLTDGIELGTLLVISATVIAAIRMTSYYKEDLSKDLAKLLPFTLLGVSITQSSMFSFDKVLAQLGQLPQFFSEITIYLAFIIFLEFVLRTLDLLFTLGGLQDPKEVKEDGT